VPPFQVSTPLCTFALHSLLYFSPYFFISRCHIPSYWLVDWHCALD
jgi:hypothetical protein